MTRRRRSSSPTCRACGARIVWARDVDTGANRPLDLYLEQGVGKLYALVGDACHALDRVGMGHPDHRDTCPDREPPPNPHHPAIPD